VQQLQTAAGGVPIDVILRDGSTLRLRSPRRRDTPALVEFFARLSVRSRYLRFHGARHIEAHDVERLVEPDWDDRGALLGTLAEPDDEEHVVAVAEYVRLRDLGTAEVAFAVADQLQGHGLGTRLLEQLACRAASAGVREFVAAVLPDNAAMLGVFRDAGFEVSRTFSDGAVEVRFPIAATGAYDDRVERRDHEAVTASLRPCFAPASVAVVGASKRRGSIGGELFRNILVADFAGAAYPVNRDGDAVAGVRGYRSVEEIPDTVDLAVICVPARTFTRRQRMLCAKECTRFALSLPASPRPAATVRTSRSDCSSSHVRTEHAWWAPTVSVSQSRQSG
jgi:RimJ/RimL family protein N-acetyltransferase/predicted CoA-binding protein